MRKSVFDGPCYEWPHCYCAERCNYWTVKLEEFCHPPYATLEQIEWAQLDLHLVLSCMSYHCPDRRARRKATLQLLYPVFKPQWKEFYPVFKRQAKEG
jgi:hypothetical protein